MNGREVEDRINERKEKDTVNRREEEKRRKGGIEREGGDRSE